MLTLLQIKVIRAILVTGTAARLLNVSSPGISRVMKHAEAEATPVDKDVYDQIRGGEKLARASA